MHPTTHHNTKERLLPNLTANVALFLGNVGMNIWLVPYLIRHLGVAAYGLIPLATSMTAYMSLLTLSLNGSLSRFLTIDLQRGDATSARQTFNTAFAGSLGVVFVLLPVAGLIAYVVPSVMDVPQGHAFGARLLFLTVMLSFLLSAVSSNFTVSSFAHGRFDLRNGVEVAGLITRVVLIVLLFNTFSPQLSHIGLAYLGGAVITLIAGVGVWKRLTPELGIDFRAFTRSRLREITGMSGWIVVNQLASLLFLNVDLLIVNRSFGADAGGRYASVLQWSILLRVMAHTLSSVLTPTILAYYARGEMDRVREVSQKAVKFLGLTMALPIGLVCGFAPSLLKFWLGQEFVGLTPLLWLLVGHLCINLAVLPLFNVQVACNRVRVPGLVSLAMGAGNLVLAITLPRLFGWGFYGVAVAGAVMLTLKNALFTPWYGARILAADRFAFVKPFFPGLAAAISVYLVALSIDSTLHPSGWFDLLMCGSAVCLLYLFLTFFFVLKLDERRLLLSLVPQKAS